MPIRFNPAILIFAVLESPIIGYSQITLHYIILQVFKGGLSRNFKDHRAQHATQATV